MATYKKRTDISLNKWYMTEEEVFIKVVRIADKFRIFLLRDIHEENPIMTSYIGSKNWLQNKLVKYHEISINIICV